MDCAQRYWYRFEGLSPQDKCTETSRFVGAAFRSACSSFSRKELSGWYSFFLEVGTSATAYMKAVKSGSLRARAQRMEGRRVFRRLAHAMNDIECLSGIDFLCLFLKQLLMFYRFSFLLCMSDGSVLFCTFVV